MEKGEEEKEDRISNVEALLNAAVDHSEKTGNQNVSSFLENVSLIADIDSWADKEERVTLMTLHSAKGLEFDAVFIAGCEENLLPHKNSLENSATIEEERRLCYVGITRAKKDLFLSHSKSRLQWGNRQYSRKSRFLLEIPETLLVGRSSSTSEGTIRKGFSLIRNWEDTPAPPSKIIPQTPNHDLDDTPVRITVTQGNMVRHPIFGKGVVMSVVDQEEDSRITIIFEKHGTKVLQGQYANLQKI